ncbi:hypothetical protein Tco_0552618, partial [Tanacetum coccineum]
TYPGIPSYFNDRDATLLRLLDLLIHDFHWFFNEVKLVMNLDLIQRDYV